ncbi:glycoside hydrolase family protein [Colletotrichum sojae]|uniref:Glycoside hydrolase family protein n=1 Tax=Colletotrichum sojae TaxID=2175907 RepID=A0A8H6MLJ4_9PEZI|nr:glycoside hydrolase family protein [Colletotrichum sojae]
MASSQALKVYDNPPGITISGDLVIETRPTPPGDEDVQPWSRVPAYAVEVANANITRNAFNRHTVALASFDLRGPVTVRVKYTAGTVKKAAIRPHSLGIPASVEGDEITFSLDRARDVMLEITGYKWKAVHLLVNTINANAPTHDTDDIWYFGPGINQGSAYSKINDGVNLMVRSGKTVYLAGGAFITWVTSIGANGFSLSAGEGSNVHTDRYWSFSFAGNGDGIDFFCSSDITIENCFLGNSDDTIALYSHRWDWYGDSKNITIRNCVLLPDIAHAINMGTHGNPAKPDTTSNIRISNIDILDHEENQLWYQGCIAINAADENLFHDIRIEDVRVERITRGQLFNIRVMQNSMWTTTPGRGIRDVVFKNVSLSMDDSKVVNPSMMLGYDQARQVENVTFENPQIGDRVIHEEMEKPRWYMVSDLVPVFANEHVKGLKFAQ